MSVPPAETSRAEPRKTAFVTGATGGISRVTALDLARSGYRVLLTARDVARGREVIETLRTQSGNDALELFVADLSRMAEVRRLGLEVRARHPRLEVLVNNAGGLFRKRRLTPDGFETTLALNHLAYFLLTQLLLPGLKAAGNTRVVNVSSTAHRLGRVRWHDLQFERAYSAAAYNQSKLLNVLFSNALARRLRGTGVTSNALHPGAVRSGFDYNLGGAAQVLFNLGKLMRVSPERGAETSVYLATADEVAEVTEAYFACRRPRRAARLAYDEGAQERLWAVTEWLEPAEPAEREALG